MTLSPLTPTARTLFCQHGAADLEDVEGSEQVVLWAAAQFEGGGGRSRRATDVGASAFVTDFLRCN